MYFSADILLSGRCSKLPCSNVFADGAAVGSVWCLRRQCTAWDKITIANYFRMKGICEISISNVLIAAILCVNFTCSNSGYGIVWG